MRTCRCFFYFYSTWNFSSSIYCSPPVRERVGISTSKAWSKSSWPPLSVRPCGTRSSFSNTRGTKPLPVRPNHRPALLRVRDPKPIHSLPGTTGGPGSSLSDIRRISLQGKGPRREGDAQRAGWEGERGVSVRAGCLRAGKREKRGGRQGWRERERHGWRACTHIGV